MSKVKIILGIDPGTNVMGYGLIKVEGSELTLIEFSDISLKKHDDHYLKLKYIFSGLTEIIEKYKLGIELSKKCQKALEEAEQKIKEESDKS